MFISRRKVLLICTLSLFACHRESVPREDPIEVVDSITLTGETTVTLSAEGGSLTVPIIASGDWKAALANYRASDWISFESDSGRKEDTSLRLFVAPNDETDERSATIRLSCGKASASFTVIQKQKDALVLTPSKYQIDAGGGSFSIVVKANIDYSFEIEGKEWIHFVSTRSMVEKTTTFSVDANTDTRKREGTISVVSSIGKEQVTLYQEAADPSIVLSTNQVSVPAAGGTFGVEINTNVDVTMEITGGSDWLSELESRSSSTHSYNFIALVNEDTSSRVGEITFRNETYGLTEKVTVTQMQKNALVVSPPVIEVGANSSTIGIQVATNVDYDVQIDADWISRIGTRSLREDTVEFLIMPNALYDAREGTLTFSAEDLSQTVIVRQDAAKGFIAGYKEQYTLNSHSQLLELSASANVPIEATPLSDWIHVVETKALESHSVILSIEENDTDVYRKGQVLISSPEAGVYQEINIIQLGEGDVFVPDDAFWAWLLAHFDNDKDGVLSKKECEVVDRMEIWDDIPGAHSLSGIEYFPNLIYFAIRNSSIQGSVDFGANTQLRILYFESDESVSRILIGSEQIESITADGCFALTEIILPEAECLSEMRAVRIKKTALTSFDLSAAADLRELNCLDCPVLKDVYLRMGTECELSYNPDITTIHYIGENLKDPIKIEDPVFKKLLLKTNDWDGNGELSKREARDISSLTITNSELNGVLEEGDTLRSFKGISQLRNLESFILLSSGSLAGRIRAEFTEEFASLSQLSFFCVEGDIGTGPYLGFYGSIPAAMGDLPHLGSFYLNGCPITGTIPENLILNKQTRIIDVRYCSLSPTHVTVPASELLDYPERDTYAKVVYAFDQFYLEWKGTGYYLKKENAYISENKCPGNLTFRSDIDGTGPAHPDGEVVLFHQSTKGEGINLFITGDGFTEANNARGGTLETYLYHSARTLLNQDPFNKLQDYLNIYLLFAHSETEGVGTVSSTDYIDETDFLVSKYYTKFKTSMTNPAQMTACSGDREAVLEFIRDAGLDDKRAIVCVLLNAQDHAGTCYMSDLRSLYGMYTVCYVPVSRTFEGTLIHEFGGHGYGRLGDEYGGYAGAYVNHYYWVQSGALANVDSECNGNPAMAPWAPYLNDNRYATEDVGLYEGGYSGDKGVWRSSFNSIMRIQWEEFGDRFNVPSREAIYYLTHFLSEASLSSWTDWKDFYDHQDREEFIAFDKQDVPALNAPKKVRNRRYSPILSNGRRMPEPPPPTPPVLVE